MLEITIPATQDTWDANKEEFVSTPECTIRLEHSLVSISKWEAKWHKPFLENKQLSKEELIDYVRCMTLTQCVKPEIYRRLTDDNMKDIQDYIADPMTATWFSKNVDNEVVKGAHGKKEIVTSELIYYWMIAQNIPVEFEKWHLSRLMTLIKVCSAKNSEANGGSKKMTKNQIYNQNKQLNAARRAKLHSKG